MATVAGVYSVDRNERTPEEIVAALVHEERPQESTRRHEPYGKHLTVHFPEVYVDGTEQVMSTGAIEVCCCL